MSSDAAEPEPEFSTDPTAPGGDEVDPAMNVAITAAMQKCMETERITVGWMTGETGNHINMAMSAAHSSIQMAMMRQGLKQDQAQHHAGKQMLLLAFELGRRVGTEMEAARAMKEMFGDLDFGD